MCILSFLLNFVSRWTLCVSSADSDTAGGGFLLRPLYRDLRSSVSTITSWSPNLVFDFSQPISRKDGVSQSRQGDTKAARC